MIHPTTSVQDEDKAQSLKHGSIWLVVLQRLMKMNHGKMLRYIWGIWCITINRTEAINLAITSSLAWENMTHKGIKKRWLVGSTRINMTKQIWTTCAGSHNKNCLIWCLLWWAQPTQLSCLIIETCPLSFCGESEEAFIFMTTCTFIIIWFNQDDDICHLRSIRIQRRT